MGSRIKKPTWEDIRNKRFTLLGIGSELWKMADKESEKYKQLKNKYDDLEADIQEMVSYLDGSYDAQKLINAASKAKAERDEAMYKERSESIKLDEKLKKLEFKREEEIQKIEEMRQKLSKKTTKMDLLSGDEEYDEVLDKAEEWKIQNEMVKRSLNLRAINARIGMTKIRKSSQDAKDIENIKKVIDTYNESITEYKKEMDELNNKRPKSIPEEFMRENDWILGVVTMDKNKKIQEIITKIDEENREIREFGQQKYLAKAEQEYPELPYKVLDDKERNELIKYSEEMTTFKQLTEFLKIKVARAAGTVVGLTILAARKIKSIFKPKEEADAVEEAQKTRGDTFVEKSRDALEETVGQINLEKSEEKQTEELSAKQPIEEATVEQPSEELVTEEPIEENVEEQPAKEALEEVTEEQPVEDAVVKSSPKTAIKVKVKKVTPNNAVSQKPVKVTPLKARIAVSSDVKKAIEAVPKTNIRKSSSSEREIDTNTFE